MMRHSLGLLLLATATAAVHAQDAGKPSSTDRDDAAIYRRIEQVRRATAGFRLDGSDRDWRRVPQISAPRGDARGDDSRDIVAVAVAPRENDLCVMLRTAGGPSTDNWVFYLEVDLFGSHADDFRIELESLRRGPALRPYDENRQPGQPVPLRNARVVIRRVMEMRIPYSDIAAALPHDKASLVEGEKARPWVRVRSWTWDAARQRPVDFGPAVASYRLIETPYPLDTPLPARPQPPVAVGLPLRGQWFVSQGAMDRNSHQNVWAYDLVKLDPSGSQSSPRDSKKNADYYAWGQPVFSSVHGRVLRARSTVEDSPVRQPGLRGSVANQVYIASSNGFGLDLVHLQKDGTRVEASDRVSPGQQVGSIGNSGRSDVPHLHMAIWTGRFPRRTVPLAWTNVRVGLNPGADDPWTRELPRWEPRAGLFVEPMVSAAGR